VGGFIRDGLADGEPVMVMATPEKLQWLRAALGPDAAAAVEFADSRKTYRPQAQVTRVATRYLQRTGRRPSRIVAEQALARRSRREVQDYMRIEAAANVVYQPFPVSILCPYDASALSQDVLLACRQTHPQLLTDHRLQPSGRFTDPEDFITATATAVPPPPSAASFTCDTSADLAPARSFLRSQAQIAGLRDEEAENLVLAAFEIVTNAVFHGKPPRRLYVYREDQALVCHVHDSGTGIDNPLYAYIPPGNDPAQGRGLWLVRQLTDCLDIATDATGTHVRTFTLLPPTGKQA
jgi:anti-sigma regulatory factor (Ser/Thr protein kinase)